MMVNNALSRGLGNIAKVCLMICGQRGGRHFIPQYFIPVYSYCDEMVVVSRYVISSLVISSPYLCFLKQYNEIITTFHPIKVFCNSLDILLQSFKFSITISIRNINPQNNS